MLRETPTLVHVSKPRPHLAQITTTGKELCFQMGNRQQELAQAPETKIPLSMQMSLLNKAGGGRRRMRAESGRWRHGLGCFLLPRAPRQA